MSWSHANVERIINLLVVCVLLAGALVAHAIGAEQLSSWIGGGALANTLGVLRWSGSPASPPPSSRSPDMPSKPPIPRTPSSP